MPPQRCALCGKEFERGFGDTSLSQSCPECDLKQQQAEKETILAASEPTKAASSPITIALIAINVLVFGFMVLRGVSWFEPTGQQAIAFGADFGPSTIVGGQWWRLVTSMFVHFGII